MSDINSLRSTLFDTLAMLKDNKIDLDRAKAINETAQTIINTAKVEVDYMKASGATGSTGFIPATQKALPDPSRTGTGTKQTTEVPGGSVTQHRMRG